MRNAHVFVDECMCTIFNFCEGTHSLHATNPREKKVSIICTQPRRISAISVAERVAAERGERVGETVGYAVRGESKQGSDTALLFCTTGVLLRMLEDDPDLEGATHVLVDEVILRCTHAPFRLEEAPCTCLLV
jgi:hypothetical protein